MYEIELADGAVLRNFEDSTEATEYLQDHDEIAPGSYVIRETSD